MPNELIAKLERADGPDNALDVLVEVALFQPSEIWPKCRANAAGTKVIYTNQWGAEHTFCARDWTMLPLKSEALASLRARSQGGE